MKILFVNRPEAIVCPGGDTVQMQNTRSSLIEMGHTVDVVLTEDPDPAGYDVAHVFNLQTADVTLKQVTKLKDHGIPMALSTIWWDNTEACWADEAIPWIFDKSTGYADLTEKLKLVEDGSFRMAGDQAWRDKNLETGASQKKILDTVDILLPNSQLEMEKIASIFSLEDKAHIVIPNSIDADVFDQADPDIFLSKYGVKDFILCVGRIEGRKNQLMLIWALRDLKIPLVLMGNAYDGYYYDLCRRFAVLPILHVAQTDQKVVASAMAAARVHALPSWLETPGLASLEALYSGLPIVVGNRGAEVEYFKDAAYYCDPGSSASILEAVETAFESGPRASSVNKALISETYTWENAAKKTLEAYALISK